MRMFRAVLVAILALASASYAGAAPGNCGSGPMLTTFAGETLTVSSTALGFTSTVAYPPGVQPAILAVCNVRGDVLSATDTGVVPTSSVGAQWAVGSTFSVCGVNNVKRWRGIRVTNDVTLYCEYSREGDQ